MPRIASGGPSATSVHTVILRTALDRVARELCRAACRTAGRSVESITKCAKPRTRQRDSFTMLKKLVEGS